MNLEDYAVSDLIWLLPGPYGTVLLRTGAPGSTSEPRLYVVLGQYPLAAVCELFYARSLRGNSDDPLYPEIGGVAPEIGRRACL